jgi:hypothetical protein
MLDSLGSTRAGRVMFALGRGTSSESCSFCSDFAEWSALLRCYAAQRGVKLRRRCKHE